MKNRIQLAFAILTLFPQLFFAQKINFEKIPGWVKDIKIPEEFSVSQYDVLSGFYSTLADYQVNLDENMTFNHEVINVLSYSGITNASQLSVVFDTSYQQLHINHLYIWRKGAKIDRTDSLRFEIMNNENNLDKGLYMGTITAYTLLHDIRKNDLIDFAYTLEGSNPIFNNEKYLFIPLASLNPIDLYSIRVLYSKDKNYTYHCSGGDSIISISETGNYHEIEIVKKNMAAIKYEDNMPTWQMPYDYFTLSSFNSWKDVNKWAQAVFALKTAPALNPVFEEIFTGIETTEEKIDKIIDYVQDDIRYMGIESGIGSIKPFPPDQVVKQRFGDCKDKSLLMVSLLKKICIDEAYPALVNTFLKQETHNQYPSNQLFNHCIVTFNFKNQTYWVDPTIAMQGGNYKTIVCPNYGNALIVGIPEDTLYALPSFEVDTSVSLTEELNVQSFTEPATLIMTSSRYGFEADNRRAALKYFTQDNISEQLTKELKLLYPEVIQTKKSMISDDPEHNIFSTNYYYQVNGFMRDTDKDADKSYNGIWIFKYEPLSVYEYLNLANCVERKYDMELKYPLKFHCKLTFHFPKEIYTHDDFMQVDNAAYIFEQKTEQLDNNSLQIDYSLVIKSNSIKAQEFSKICDQTKTLMNELPIVFFFYK